MGSSRKPPSRKKDADLWGWGFEGLPSLPGLFWASLVAQIGEGNGSPLQCSCLDNPRDRVAQIRTRLKCLRSSSSGSDGRESACSTGDLGSTPGSDRAPREGDGYPLQYSCLENSTDRGVQRVTVRGGHTDSDTMEGLTHPPRPLLPRLLGFTVNMCAGFQGHCLAGERRMGTGHFEMP